MRLDEMRLGKMRLGEMLRHPLGLPAVNLHRNKV